MVYPLLTDYLGRVRSISEIIPSRDANIGQKSRRKVDTESLDDNVVEFIMWDDLVHKLNKTEIDALPFPTILVVSSCRVSKYRDLLQLTATSATHFYINPRTQEVKDAHTMFKEKYSSSPPL